MKKGDKPKLLGDGMSVAKLDDSQLAAQAAAARARYRALGLPAVIAESASFGLSREVTWGIVRRYFDVSYREFKQLWDSTP